MDSQVRHLASLPDKDLLVYLIRDTARPIPIPHFHQVNRDERRVVYERLVGVWLEVWHFDRVY